MAYSAVDDLLTGNIPVPSYLSPQKIVDDAADEIDSYIGFRYITPVVLDPAIAEHRPVILLLKRINAHLATGRLLMAAASAQEDTQLHAYAKRMVDESLAALIAIRDGELVLTDVPVVPGTVVAAAARGPIQYNKDPISQVEAFYDQIAFAPPVAPRAWPGW